MPTTVIEGAQRTRARVLIAGGGVAAAEALLALARTASPHVELELLAPRRELTVRALAVAEPFGLVEPHRLDLEAIATEHGARFRLGTLARVDAARRVALTADGASIHFDALLVATGTRHEPALPGALTFGGPHDVPAFRALLDELEQGASKRIAFALPPAVRWSLPLYELAMLTAAHAARRGLDATIELVTHERRPLELFGLAVSDHVGGLLDDAGVRLTTDVVPVAVQPGKLILAPAGCVAADDVVALPLQRGPHIAGLPRGPGGFIPVDPFGRVDGLEGVYAAGDITWYPVKQGGLAAQQADAAASAIAAAAGAGVVPRPFEPVLRGVMLTGGAPAYIRGKNGSPTGPSETPLWWPPAKVAGRYLAPYLAETRTDVPLHDAHTDHHPALELALDAADANAGWGDFGGALRWLDAAERMNVALPPDYAQKRVRWRAARAAAAH
jgi:sulfide:quinone oxidoreductase